MDFYLNLLNDQQRCPDDGPSIGIILCAEKNDVEVEYALKSKTNPIGVAQYELQSKLPSELEGKLPTAEQLASVVRRSLPSTPNARTHGRKWRTAMTDQRDSIAQSIRSLCVKSLRNPAIEFLRTFGYESDRMINLGSSNPETFLAFVNQSSAAGVINKSRAHRPPDLRKRASGRVAQQRALERLVAQPVKRQ
jgi:hypothetical protein